MRVDRKSLYSFSMPYALSPFVWQGRPCLAAAPEDKGPVVVSVPPYDGAEVVVDGPGGCLALTPHPDRPDELFAIMGCFLGYQFAGGALYHLHYDGQWHRDRIADLPFGHRAQVVGPPGARELVVTTLAHTKRDPADWSEPGTVYSLAASPPWNPPLTPILEGVHKNHGFFHQDGLWITGEEGVFHRAPGSQAFERVFDHEVSELVRFDAGDGRERLVTIEPFHGPVLAVYEGSPWRKVAEAELSYGHGLLVDTIGGQPAILVSNRSGDRNLMLMRWDGGRLVREVLDAGVGAANMAVIHEPNRDVLFAACQTAGEVVRYSLT